jgi:flagellar basal-body rod modification protein FlgD
MVATVVTDPITGLPKTQVSSGSAVQEQEDRFLKLLVAQMNNQDPLNPLDNAEVTSQMAQLSTVTGIEKLNATLESMGQLQSYQAAGMIGHGVLAPGSFMTLSGGSGVAGFELPKAADEVTAKVFNGSGQLVRELDLGKQSGGSNLFSWDGKDSSGAVVADGNYTFTVTAKAAGEAVNPTSLAVGLVTSVLMDKAGPKLLVEGMGQIDMANVKQIL